MKNQEKYPFTFGFMVLPIYFLLRLHEKILTYILKSFVFAQKINKSLFECANVLCTLSPNVKGSKNGFGTLNHIKSILDPVLKREKIKHTIPTLNTIFVEIFSP